LFRLLNNIIRLLNNIKSSRGAPAVGLPSERPGEYGEYGGASA